MTTTTPETGMTAAQTVPQQDVSPLGIVARAASDPSVDADKMERLYALMERQQAWEAKKQFEESMSLAQSKMGRISADATNPQTRSKYATYGKLDKALRPIYSSNGFSLSFNTTESPLEGHMRFLCDCSHSAGHTKLYQIDMPVDGKGAKGNDVMTKTHAVGSGASYGMRYLLKMIFNVAVGEDDDDGNAAGKPPSEAEINADNWVERANKVAEPAEYLSERAAMMKFYDAYDDNPPTLRRIPAAVKRAFSEAKNEVMPKDET